MKEHSSMKLKKYILPLLAVLSLASCNQEEVNRGSLGLTNEELRREGLSYGGPLLTMQLKVIPIGSPSETTGPGNDLAATDIMSSGNYIGYFGMNNNWGFRLEHSWNFSNEGRMKYIYEVLYANFAASYREILQALKGTTNPYELQVLAMANTMKVLAWTRATDGLGPIVYTTAGDGNITPTPDSQEVVYKAMLKELYEQAKILHEGTSTVASSYDIIYNGDTKKWAKLANSLMLRLAVRVHFKDEALAKEYIAKAMQNGGPITEVADEAVVRNSSKQPLLNPFLATIGYDELRMGATIWSYLKGYEDSRIDKYFVGQRIYWLPEHYAIAPTNTDGKTDRGTSFSKPNVDEGTQVVWFRASETSFLKAEAALYGLTSGNVKSLYEEGVRKSFQEQGAELDDYLYKTRLPMAYDGSTTSGHTIPANYSDDISAGNVSPMWDEDATTEKKLQRIITQKYLALYPNAMEAWTEYRRTGYPYLMKPADAAAQGRIGAPATARTPERFTFSPLSYGANPNLKASVPSLLGGEDKGSTKLWWVRADRPVQQ